MWLLREFVEDPKNYRNSRAEQDGARDAIQTLGAFVEDNSSVKGHYALTYFEAPQPIIISRAMFQLRELASNQTLGSHDVDISRGNLHGISLPSFSPRGSFLAVAADFRRANLTGLDLTPQPGPTCATCRG